MSSIPSVVATAAKTPVSFISWRSQIQYYIKHMNTYIV